MPPESFCPCGSSLALSACCQPYLLRQKLAPTAQALMRSRYTAFVLANLNYIQSTMAGRALANLDFANAELMIKQVTWVKLEVLNHTEDTVEFKAHMVDRGEYQIIHERDKSF